VGRRGMPQFTKDGLGSTACPHYLQVYAIIPESRGECWPRLSTGIWPLRTPARAMGLASAAAEPLLVWIEYRMMGLLLVRLHSETPLQ
jgi:hypothetical protein